MVRHIATHLLLGLLCLTLLLPKVGGLLIEIMPGVTTAVICTGSETVVLTLDSNGAPIEELPEALPDTCILADAKSVVDVPTPVWVRLARSLEDRFVPVVTRREHETHPASPPPAQAPPVLV
jgi:hypothetical protein